MILSRLLMVPSDRVQEAQRGHQGQPWPGDERVPPRAECVCRKVVIVEERDKNTILELIYEG